uniref:Uncharacterized protein n=1 Tax=Panagrolaimus davidi TaxID=227884 RepID=A0A914PKV7_9BILA
MKSHRFFLHLKDELLNFGTPYDFSTAFFEMLNRIIKVGFNAFDTTSLPLRALTMMLARKDWIAQVINRENKSKKFNKIVDTICPSFTIRKIVYAKDDLVLYRLHGEICYGKILSSQNSMFNIQQINGISLMQYGNDDTDLPGDIRYAFFLFNQHPPFGIKVTAYATSATVLKQDIICHCCMFSDNFHSYIFSLDFRLSGK